MTRLLPQASRGAVLVLSLARLALAEPEAEVTAVDDGPRVIEDAEPAQPRESDPTEAVTEDEPLADELWPDEPLEPPQSESADANLEGELLDPAPPEPEPAPMVAPPPPPPEPPARVRGPLGLSPSGVRTLGWVTLAVSTAAGIGLTAAGIVSCQGQSADCIQGQPLIWTGGAVGLAGIPIGLSLIVRGNELRVLGPLALRTKREF